MKLPFKKFQFLFVAVIIYGGSIQITISNGHPETFGLIQDSYEIADDLVGGWEYTAQGAPEGYDKGLLLIVGQDGKYQVQVQTSAGTFVGENVTVKKNTISFSLMIEGGLVTVNLTAVGSKISGKSSSPEGDYVIEGVKSISPE
jgi:hypothetical protein